MIMKIKAFHASGGVEMVDWQGRAKPPQNFILELVDGLDLDWFQMKIGHNTGQPSSRLEMCQSHEIRHAPWIAQGRSCLLRSGKPGDVHIFLQL